MEPSIVGVEVLPGYRLALTFQDGLSGVVDFTPLLSHFDTGVFVPLRDPAHFAKVFINPDWGTIEWPGEVDLDPYVLYNCVKAGGGAVPVFTD